MVDNKKNSKKQYAAPEALYDLDGEQSVKTIHEINNHCYVGLPGAATLDLSKKAIKKVVCLEDSEDEEDDMSEISNISREALIELIRKQNNNKMSSYPKKIITSRISYHLNLVMKKASQTQVLRTHLQIKVLKYGSDKMQQIKNI